MDFELSEELKMIRSLAHDFVVNELRPLERDLLGKSADLSDAQATLSPETEGALFRKARDAGLWGASVPEELGGVGLGTLANCIIEEELAQTVVPFDLGDVSPILFDSNESQRARYVTPILNHEKSAYLALMEPGLRNERLMKTSARKDDSHYILSGVKSAVGRWGKDSFAVVFALLAEGKGPTCFLVDAGTPGFDLQVAGRHSAAKTTLLVRLQNCRVPESNRLGEEGKAFSLGKKWLPARRVVRGARALGVAQRLLEEATLRAQTTQWFGKPASERPSVRSAFAEIATDVHACRILVYEAAWKSDEGRPIRNEASMVKLFATQMLRNVAARVSHIYGGPSNLPANGPCQSVLDATTNGITAELQKDMIAREVLKGLKI